MAEIQLLSVENTLHRNKAGALQSLVFWLQVENLAYDKQVDVLWAGEDQVWHSLPAQYYATRHGNQEYWRARISLRDKTGAKLPGGIRFALRLRSQGDEYWDNNGGGDYFSRAGSGVALPGHVTLQNLNFKQRLDDGQQFVPIKVAVNPAFHAEKVIIYWTVDNWRSSRHSVCHRQKHTRLQAAQTWTARLKVDDAFALQYSICCKSHQHEVWDNNHGQNYRLSHAPLRILILNLHCYQEPQQDRKFSQIAKAIAEQAVDVVCLQEVAEYWNQGQGDWASNSANIINQRLPIPMHIYSDWSHLGFDKYREGVAILSRYPLEERQARYVSDSHDAYSIHSRKVVMAQISVPNIGPLQVFSAHLSWWEDGFQQQFQRLSAWADSLRNDSLRTSLLCGDFNIAAGSLGYRLVVEGHQYEDQYLAANQQGLFEQIFRVNDAHWGAWLADDYRIDYIFMNKNSDLQVTSARVLFTEQDYGPVSDHCGYLLTFEPR